MALVTCKYCGKTISDKAAVCPSCGCKVDKEITCSECGYVFSSETTSCPQCGCPVSPETVDIKETKVKSSKKKTVIILSVVIAVIICAVSGILIFKNKEAERAQAELEIQVENYKSSMVEAVNTMSIGIDKSEYATHLVRDIWHNVIYQKNDPITDKYTVGWSPVAGAYLVAKSFDYALGKLYKDEEFIKEINNIKQNQADVKEIMKGLTNPPEGCQEAYETLKAYYDTYVEYTNLAIDPQGDYESYTNSLYDSEANITKYNETMNIYLEK